MKTTFRFNALSIAALMALGLLGTAHAAGTAAGTTVNNKASLDYTVNGTTQSTLQSCASACNSTSGSNTGFVVDAKINLTVAPVDTTYKPIVPGGTAVTVFDVTNSSNTPLDFALLADGAKASSTYTGVFSGNSSVTDDFNLSSCAAYYDANGNGIHDGTETQTYLNDLAADATARVVVECSASASQALGGIAVVGLTATAKQTSYNGTNGVGDLSQSTQITVNSQLVDVVFADGAGDGGDAARDGASSDLSAYRVETSNLKITKTATTFCDPVNFGSSPKDIPGALVRYTITVYNDNTNAGSNNALVKSAILGNLTDVLVSELNFDEGYQTAAATCTATTANPNGTTASFNAAALTTAATRPTPVTDALSSVSLATSAGGVDTVTIPFGTLLDAQAGYSAGELKAGETVTVKFNAKIN